VFIDARSTPHAWPGTAVDGVWNHGEVTQAFGTGNSRNLHIVPDADVGQSVQHSTDRAYANRFDRYTDRIGGGSASFVGRYANVVPHRANLGAGAGADSIGLGRPAPSGRAAGVRTVPLTRRSARLRLGRLVDRRARTRRQPERGRTAQAL